MRNIAEFRKGSGPISMNAIDFYYDEDGNIIQHSWAMGGETRKVVDSVPCEIDGYKLIHSSRKTRG